MSFAPTFLNGAAAAVDAMARNLGFSGAVRLDHKNDSWATAYGHAHRSLQILNTTETQFAIASGGKGLTALTVVSLIEDRILDWSTPARSALGADLPHVSDSVTVELLLAHRSGIGDYLDEDEAKSVNDYALAVPVQNLESTEDYLPILDGIPPKSAPDERFAYNNSGYVLLALIAERVTGVEFQELVRRRVCDPAEMDATEFLRSDRLPAQAALGYLDREGDQTNIFHLPVRGSGDGGIYSTLSDIGSLWNAMFDGRIVSRANLERMLSPRSLSGSRSYGLGFWLGPRSPVVSLEGYDAGVSFRTSHDPERRITYTVMANTSEGAWPLVSQLDQALGFSERAAAAE